MPQRKMLLKFPGLEAREIQEAMRRPWIGSQHTVEQVGNALLLQRRKPMPLTLALEQRKGLGIAATQSQRIAAFVAGLNERHVLKTKDGEVIAIPSFKVRTSPASLSKVVRGPQDQRLQKTNPVFGLHYFTCLAFRIVPTETDMQAYRRFFPNFKRRDPEEYAMIVEIGFARQQDKPVVVVTNAQAKKEYYSLPWSLKKRFRGAYDAVLGLVQKTSGTQVLIPTNATVNGLLGATLNHKVSASVLGEFYDAFSAKRKRQKATLSLKNELDNQQLTAEFWVPEKT